MKVLYVVLGVANLNYEELVTVLTEIECVINTRPMSYLYENETTEAVTPSHLVIERNIQGHIKYDESNEFNMTQSECTRRFIFL